MADTALPDAVYAIVKNDVSGGDVLTTLSSEVLAKALCDALKETASPDESYEVSYEPIDDLAIVREVCANRGIDPTTLDGYAALAAGAAA